MRRILRFLRGRRGRVAPSATAPDHPWRSERVVTEFDDYLTQLEADLAAARTAILMEVYIFGDDEPGARVVAALTAAAARGVQVRLMVDGAGSLTWIRHRAAAASAGLDLRIYHPLPWLTTGPLHPGAWWRVLSGLRRLNRRNHRKVCVIDDAVAWVGSMNIERRHSRACCGDDAWRDAVARIEGGPVELLEAAFSAAWRRAWRVHGRRLRPAFTWRPLHVHAPPGAAVRLNHGFRLRRRYWRELLARIAAARGRVWLANAYFVPRGDLIRALGAAAANGADVRVLTPGRSDLWFMPLVAAVFADRLARLGVHLHQYQPAMLHAKVAIIDGWVTVGSTNLNSRSLNHDLEADVVLAEPASRTVLEEHFTEGLAQSVELTARTHRPGLLTRLVGNTVLILRAVI
jgi:cardiolipin synthase